MHAKKTTLLLLLFNFLLVSFSFSQSEYTPYDELPTLNKSDKPAFDKNYPEWGKLLYQFPIDFNDISEKFDSYTRIHGKVKNPIVRYFKLWRRAVGEFANADGTINLPNLKDYFENQDGARRRASYRTKSISVTDSNWTFLGPKQTFWLNESNSAEAPSSCPWQVNVYSFDVAASNNDILYSGTETGFVNKTIDKGLSWTLLAHDYPFGGGISAVAIHPENPDVVYVSGGKQIHKSTDGGLNWSPMLAYNNQFSANRLKIDTKNPEKIIASSSQGLYISKDGGVSWTKQWSYPAFDIDIKPDDSNNIYGITKNSNGKYSFVSSIDGGENFTVQGSFPSNITEESGALLAVTPANPNIVYVIMLCSNEDKAPYLYKGSLNNGNWTWTKKATGKTNSFEMNIGQGYFDLVLEISPNDENTILVGTTTLFKSTNGGTNFSVIGGYWGDFAIHPDMQDLKMLPSGETWLATDGGMSLTTDNFHSTSNYSARINGIVGSDMWGFDQGWNEDLVVGGRYHNGNTAISELYGDKALRMGGAESPTGWVLQGKSRHVAFNDLSNGWILPKTAEGKPEGRFIFSKYPNMVEYGGRRGNLVHHPNYYGTLYLGEGNGFWKSTDMGESFDLLHNFSDPVRFVQINYKNPMIMYADVVNRGLYRSSDGGETWEARPSLTSGSYGNSYWKGKLFFALSPNYDDVIYACLSNGAWSADIGKVFKSEDGGVSWINWSGNLSEYIKCLAIQPTLEGKDLVYLFTTSKSGRVAKVLMRKEDASEWSDFSTNYPSGNAVNMALPFFRDSKIRVGGSGGVWESPLAETEFTPIINFWVEKENYNCMQDTLYFDDHSILNHEGAEWKWTITPEPEFISDANIRNPKVVLGTPCDYSVKMEITKGDQTYSKTIENMVTTTTCPSLEDCGNPAMVSNTDMKLIYADSEEVNYPGKAYMAFDGDPSTIWHTRWSNGTDGYPHEIQIDLGEKYNVHQFNYLPRQSGENGRIKRYELYISHSKTDWGTPIKSGEFPNGTAPQKIKFSAPVSGQYIRLKSLSEVNNGAWTSIAELSVLGCYDTTTGISLPDEFSKMKAFPIPTKGEVTVSLPLRSEFNYEIYSQAGQVIDEGIISHHVHEYVFNLSHTNPGFYIIRLVDKSGVSYRIKVVKN